MAIRLTLLRHHYRSDWEWTDDQLWESVDRLDAWRRALAVGCGSAGGPVVDAVLGALATDLDAPTAVAAVDAWADATLGTSGLAGHDPDRRGLARVPCWSLLSTPRLGDSALVTVGSGRLQPSSVPLEVALELAGDGLTAGLGEVGRVARLLQRADVVGDVLVLLGQLVDAALPGARVLRAARRAGCCTRAAPRSARAAPASPSGRAAARRSAGPRPSRTPRGRRDARRRPGRRRRCRSGPRTSTARA